MKPALRALLLFLGLAALVLTTFALFGHTFETWFSWDASREWMQRHRSFAGPLGAGLLLADLLLPIPTTVVIAAMGAVLGVLPAFAWGWLGLSLAAFAGFGLARLGGPRLANRLCPPEQRAAHQKAFETWGGLALVLSRMLPVLPEVFSVMAGLYGMDFRRFAIAVVLGSLPPSLAYAGMGALAARHPGPAAWALVALTALAWLALARLRYPKPPPPATPRGGPEETSGRGP